MATVTLYFEILNSQQVVLATFVFKIQFFLMTLIQTRHQTTLRQLNTLMQENQQSANAITPALQSNQPLNSISQEESKKEVDSVSFFQLFRFADKFDYIMMFFGTIGALALGAATPLFILFWGDFTNVFGSSTNQIVEMAVDVLKKFIYLGIGTLACGWAMITCWLIAGERQATLCRKKYFATLLKQQIGWFDCINQSELSSNYSADTLTFQGALGEKIAVMVHVGGTFIGGFAIAFSQGWLMTFVCLAAFPIIAYAGYLYMQSLQVKSKEFQKIYSHAGGLVEQAIFSIKTVKQLNGEKHEQETYQNCLGEVKTNNLKFGVKIAASMAFMSAAMFLLYSLGYWFGSNCAEGNSSCPPSVSGKIYSAGDVVTVFFCVLVGCFNLSQLSPALKKIGEGGQAAARIFKILDREPLIKNLENGLKPERFEGVISFEGVTFSYPKDKTRKILDNISIQFHVSNTALVGESGCGKSTILQMIMRFYDPDEGRILLDGNDLRELDLVWLRNKIGYVGQEPVLFATSIKENLLLGNQRASIEEINNALKKAEAYDFVYGQLENKLETYVGAGGGQISGGQKQRIAIARALLKNPKILLLDEATSALDRRNEKLIQNTLNKISEGLTTVTVAHRVQSIMNANIIYVINKGRIEEKGKFRDLNRYKDYENKEDNHEEEEKKQQKQFLKKDSPEDLKDLQLQPIQSGKHQSVVLKQKTKKQKEVEQNAELVKKYQGNTFGRVFRYLKSQRLSFAVGILLTIILGAIYPVFSIFLSDIINALFYFSKDSTKGQGRKDADIASLVFLILAVGTFIFTLGRDFLTYVVGDEITNNIRKQAYNKILKMPIHWFDRPENNCGVLSTRLGTDCQTINGMATTYIYIMIQSLTTFAAGIVIALIYEWRTALVAIGLMPLVVLAGAIRSSFRNGLSEKADLAYRDSALIIMQSLTNIRTVVSFGVENTVLHKYQKLLEEPQAMLIRNSAISGFFFGLSQIMTFIVFGVLFYIGTIFMRQYGVTLLDVFTAVYQVFFAGITIGNNSHFIPDMNEAKVAAAHIFQILDSEDEQQIQIRQQSKMLKQGIVGHIKLENIEFKYESRQQSVFKNMNIQIHPGQKVAFVGPSGCGKSTIMQLLQRFYFPDSGKIVIDNVDIKDYDIHYLRSKLGVVSQEPVLFDGSFRENIKYNKYNATEEQIRLAAKEANALDFIEGNQKLEIKQAELEEKKQKVGQGFDRNVGLKGSHISGGQKQRVAIARTILRNPGILLLDEATSALDGQNEKRVQDSLDRIMTHKTTISIAHRIETIKNADMINVFEKGEIVQKGTYQQLINKKGFFYNLERGTQFV